MARVTTVTKAQSEHRCERCGTTIHKGQGYKWVKPRAHRAARGHKRVRCLACPSWTAGELTTSKMGVIWDAQAQFSVGDCDDVSAVEDAVSDLVNTINEVADEYETGGQNIEDGFGHETQQSTEMKEKGESLRSWAEEIENVNIPDPDEYNDECSTCGGNGECPECEGTGSVAADEDEEGVATDDCPECGGSGSCDECAGDGHTGADLTAWREAVEQALSVVQECPV